MDAKMWFDLIVSNTHAEFKQNQQWCWRHWSPCPVFGYNGLAASIEMIHQFINQEWHTFPSDPDAVNEFITRQQTPICCQLGDEAMQEIWNAWMPR